MLVRVSTYTDAPDTLDAGAAVAQMQMALGQGVQYLDGGWGSLITSMVQSFEALGGELRTGVEVGAVGAVGAGDGEERHGIVAVTTTIGTLLGRGVVLASGGPEVAERLTGAVVRGLDRITPPVTASVLDLALGHARPALAFALDRPLYLSSHAPSARLAPVGHGLVSIMRYHAPGAEAGDASVRRAELRAFAGIIGITPDDVVHERYMHRLVVTHGAPTAAGGGLAGRPRVDALGLAGVYLAGDWVGDVGLLADASASSGAIAAQMALRSRANIAA
jgi:phytoene dehydrogenase-like protein